VVAGLLKVEEDRFSNTAEADHFLVRGQPDYLGGQWELTQSNWGRMLKTAETIRAGGLPQMVDYHATSQQELAALLRGLYPGVLKDARQLMDLYDFSAYNSLLDVGGGSGALAIAIAQANPGLQATIIDLPSVTPITRQFVEEADASGSVDILNGDAVHGSLAGSYDAVIARHLIQVLSEEDSRALLRNLASVIKPGGVIYLIGMVLDDSRVSPPNVAEFNLVLLTAYEDGQAYTESEYRDWLAEAGFEDIKRHVNPDGASIISAAKLL
jgi:SAM-dependent methyltransferase